MKTEVKGINLASNVDWSKPTATFAFGDVEIPALGLTFRGVALSYKRGKVLAFPPKASGAHPRDMGLIQWDSRHAFASLIRDNLLTAYRAMGGKLPSDGHEQEADDSEAVEGLSRILSVEQEEARRVLG